MISEVRLKDYGSIDSEKSQFQEKDFTIDCSNGEDVTTQIYSFPWYKTMLCGMIEGDNCETGDTFCAWMETRANGQTPAGVMGALSANASSGQPVVNVALPVPVWQGLAFRIGTEDTDYHASSYNSTTGELTFFENLGEAKNVGDLVYIRYYNMPHIRLRKNKDRAFGKNSFGSKPFYTTMQLHIEYHHTATLTADKKIHWMLNYFLGDPNGS